jgi:hypothetical protein
LGKSGFSTRQHQLPFKQVTSYCKAESYWEQQDNGTSSIHQEIRPTKELTNYDTFNLATHPLTVVSSLNFSVHPVTVGQRFPALHWGPVCAEVEVDEEEEVRRKD